MYPTWCAHKQPSTQQLAVSCSVQVNSVDWFMAPKATGTKGSLSKGGITEFSFSMGEQQGLEFDFADVLQNCQYFTNIDRTRKNERQKSKVMNGKKRGILKGNSSSQSPQLVKASPPVAASFHQEASRVQQLEVYIFQDFKMSCQIYSGNYFSQSAAELGFISYSDPRTCRMTFRGLWSGGEGSRFTVVTCSRHARGRPLLLSMGV